MEQLRHMLQPYREAQTAGAAESFRRPADEKMVLNELPTNSSRTTGDSCRKRRPNSASIVRLAVENARRDLERQQQQEESPTPKPVPGNRKMGSFKESGNQHIRQIVANANPLDMIEALLSEPDGVNARDKFGWTALHWAALEGKRTHVSALLDSGADATVASTKVVFHSQNGNNGDRSAGTLAEDMARYPHAGRCGDTMVLKMLVAASKGTWQARIQWHGKGDCAAKQGDYNRAIECYQQALRAVPAMMEDSPVFPLHTDIKKCECKIRQRKRANSAEASDSSDDRHSGAGRSMMSRHANRSNLSKASWSDGQCQPSSPSRSDDGWHSVEDVRTHSRAMRGRQLEPLDSARSRVTERSNSTAASTVSSPRAGHYSSHDGFSPERYSRRRSGLTRRQLTESTNEFKRDYSTTGSKADKTTLINHNQRIAVDRSAPNRTQSTRWISPTRDQELRVDTQEWLHLQRAAQDADDRLRNGNAVAALFLLEEALSGQTCETVHPPELGDVVRRAASQLESEMQAARDYAHSRDAEVYKLSVARKQAEDDMAAVRATIQEQKRKVQIDLADQRRAHDAEVSRVDTELRQDHRRQIEELEQAHDGERRQWKDELRQARDEADRLRGSVSTLEQDLIRHKEAVSSSSVAVETAASETATLRLERQEAEARIAELMAQIKTTERDAEVARQEASRKESTAAEQKVELERKLECAKAVVKQWTAKCKELKDEQQVKVTAVETEATRTVEAVKEELRRATAAMEEERNRREQQSEEVANLRKQRMRDRKAIDSAMAQVAELEAELKRCSQETVDLSAQVDRLKAAAERSRTDAISKRAAEKALANLGAENADLKDERSVLLGQLETAELARAELARKLEQSSKLADEQQRRAATAEKEASISNERQEKAEKAAADALAAETAQAAALTAANAKMKKAAAVTSKEIHALQNEVESLRAELSNSVLVVERANRTAEELQEALKDKETAAQRLSEEARQHEAAISAAEHAAVEAQEAAEQTVRGMMATLKQRLAEAEEKSSAAAAAAAAEKSRLESAVTEAVEKSIAATQAKEAAEQKAAAAAHASAQELAELRNGLKAMQNENDRLNNRNRAAIELLSG